MKVIGFEYTVNPEATSPKAEISSPKLTVEIIDPMMRWDEKVDPRSRMALSYQ
jgi:hypothetical protein